MKRMIIVAALVIFSGQVLAQENQMVTMSKPNRTHLVLPLTLFAVAGITMVVPDLKQNLQENMFRTTTTIDDYLQFAPIFLMYSSYLFKARHAHNFGQQSAYWGIAAGHVCGFGFHAESPYQSSPPP